MEDFAQVFRVDPREKYEGHSYANVARVLWLETDEHSLVEFIKRLVFNIAIGNADMHLKNWSLIYRNPGKPDISPAYDFVSTIAYLDDSQLGLTLGRTKDMYSVDMDDFLYMGDKAGIPRHLVQKTVEETVDKVKDAWDKNSNDLPLLKESKQRISHHIQKLQLFKPDFSAAPLGTPRARKKSSGRSARPAGRQ